MMDVPDVIHAIAERIRTVPGVKSAHYPAVNSLNASQLPGVVLFWAGPEDTTIVRDTGGMNVWLPSVKAQILVARKNDTPKEFAAVDNLITPIVDAFTEPMHVTVDGRRGYVDRVHINRIRPTLLIGYAGHVYFGAELYFDIKFRRPAGG